MNFGAGGRPHRQRPDSRPRILPGRRAAAPLLLALLALAPFLGLQEAGFIALNDPEYVLDNARVRGGLTAASALWALTATHAANWHPATWLSHILDVELSGLAPRGHRLTSLLLHAAAALLLYAALRGMTGAGWRSAWVAALFAAHPLRVESVAWVATVRSAGWRLDP